MKKQLLNLCGTLIAVIFSIQFAAAAKINTSVSSEETYRPNNEKNIFTNTAAFLSPGSIHTYYFNSSFTANITFDNRSKPGLAKSLMGLTSIPLSILSGTSKKTAFLSFTNEKVVFGSPSHKRFSYPAIAFRIKF